MIVDLRGNGGGSLSECDSGVSAFVPSVTRIARSVDGNARTVVSQGTRLEDGRIAPGSVRNPKLWTGPLAVLVDAGSASCSEFFAYEIQYAGRGPIIGEPTAGVGNTATRIFEVGDGALQLTMLNYAKPDGTPYPTRVTPDQTFAQGEEQIRALTQGRDDLLDDGLRALAKAPVLTLDPDPMRTIP
jgi:carboxyl-terminal processing protease